MKPCRSAALPGPGARGGFTALRDDLKIPADHRCYVAATVGYHQLRLHSGPQRDGSITWIGGYVFRAPLGASSPRRCASDLPVGPAGLVDEIVAGLGGGEEVGLAIAVEVDEGPAALRVGAARIERSLFTEVIAGLSGGS